METLRLVLRQCGTQYNLFTGEPELPRTDELAETGWLFDPDFGIVLPEDVAGREVTLAEGVTLAFPAAAGLQLGKVPVRKGVAGVGFASVAVAGGSSEIVCLIESERRDNRRAVT
ncbi:MAG TPA: hypothetical protein VHA33_07685 [Candidatus Angelobacter sp.]|jgi:hypothetical protein|nr:hypothetical protein [Candidatus Angelobacter sp.]